MKTWEKIVVIIMGLAVVAVIVIMIAYLNLRRMKTKKGWLRSDIQFKVRGKMVKFTVEHNLPDHLLSIENAVNSWIMRRPPNELTPDDFVEYVKSKDPLIKCNLV